MEDIRRYNGRIGLVKLRAIREGKHLLCYTTDVNGYEYLKAYSLDTMDENYKMLEHEIEYAFTWVDKDGNILDDDVEKDCIIEKPKRFHVTFSKVDDKQYMHIYDSRQHRVRKYPLIGILTDENLLQKAELEIEIIKDAENLENMLKNGFLLD